MHDRPIDPPPLLVDCARTSCVGELVVRVSGEVDLLTHRCLQAGLAQLPLSGITSVRLGLGDLSFCDSRGMRMLITFVRSGRLAGRSVEIEDASPMFSKLLNIFDPALLAPEPDGLAC